MYPIFGEQAICASTCKYIEVCDECKMMESVQLMMNVVTDNVFVHNNDHFDEFNRPLFQNIENVVKCVKSKIIATVKCRIRCHKMCLYTTWKCSPVQMWRNLAWSRCNCNINDSTCMHSWIVLEQHIKRSPKSSKSDNAYLALIQNDLHFHLTVHIYSHLRHVGEKCWCQL